MTAKNEISLKLIIDSNATVTKSSQFKAMYDDNCDTTDDESGNAPIAPVGDDSNGSIHLQCIISHGNAFHPQSKLTIVLPSSLKKNEKIKKVLKIKIGENNLFEEESHVFLSLPLSSLERNQEDEKNDDNVNEIFTVIGSYNQFAPKCQIHNNGTTIGNGNIFHSFSTLHLKQNELVVGNGNIFNSFVSIGEKRSDNDDSNSEGDCQSESEKRYFQNQVFFVLSSVSVSVSTSFSKQPNGKRPMKLIQRTNENGVRKNMADVTLLLSVTKKILQMNHTLMSSTEIDQSD